MTSKIARQVAHQLTLLTAALAASMLSLGCAAPPLDTARLAAMQPMDVLLIGEQHDAPEHQKLAAQIIQSLAAQGVLAAVTLEMADRGVSTAALPTYADELQAQGALRWADKAWPWAAYGPLVMTAVKAGVPVLGANLPPSQFAASMANSALDGQLPGPALKAQQQGIRLGHCNLLPESQITPMTRVQIAKDIAMAQTVSQAAVTGKVVVLIAGSGHIDRKLGVPQHLPPNLKVKALALQAAGGAHDPYAEFDAVWPTAKVPEVDYCADLQKQLGGKAPLPKAN